MFWRWFSEFSFMENERGCSDSQTHAISQRLFGITFWGDYGGDIVSRYHYEMISELAPDILYKTEAAHGQGWTLGNINGHTDQLREVIRLVAFFEQGAENYGDYPIYEEDGFSEWEWLAKEKEMTEGWWAEYMVAECRRTLDTDWEGLNEVIADKGTDDWAQLVYAYQRHTDFEDDGYFEGADTFVINIEPKELALFALKRYAEGDTENDTRLEIGV